MERGIYVCTCLNCREDPKSKTARLHMALNRVLDEADEKSRRRIAGLEAMKRGWGGIQEVSKITGLSRRRISRGMQELMSKEEAPGRVREEGAGRKRVEKKRPRGSADPEGRDER